MKQLQHLSSEEQDKMTILQDEGLSVKKNSKTLHIPPLKRIPQLGIRIN